MVRRPRGGLNLAFFLLLLDLDFLDFKEQLKFSKCNHGNCNIDEERRIVSVWKRERKKKMTRLELRTSGWDK